MGVSDCITTRSGTRNFYVRYHVPVTERAAVGQDEIWRSLGMADRREARRRAPAALAKIQLDVAAAVELASPRPEPTSEQVQRAAREVYRSLVKADIEERATDREAMGAFLGGEDNALRNLSYAREVREAWAKGEHHHADVDYWALHFGFHLPTGSPRYQESAQLLTLAHANAAEAAAQHDRGFGDHTPCESIFAASDELSASEAPLEGPTLVEAFDTYADQERLRDATLHTRRQHVTRFAEAIGHDTRLSEITFEQARAWRDDLGHWPIRADCRFPGMSFPQIIRENRTSRYPAIVASTKGQYLRSLYALFTWLKRERHVKENPWPDLMPRQGRSGEDRRAFTGDQMSKLVRSPMLTHCRGTRTLADLAAEGTDQISDWRKFVLMLGIYTGARLAEICQLHVADVKKDEGITYIKICGGGSKSLKTSNAARDIPLHPDVIRAGFSD